jgi:hypothetical protein
VSRYSIRSIPAPWTAVELFEAEVAKKLQPGNLVDAVDTASNHAKVTRMESLAAPRLEGSEAAQLGLAGESRIAAKCALRTSS